MPASSALSFGAIDWLVVGGVLGVTTILGLVMGRRASLRDYFLGGRKLPWWAISASIVATEISAVTLISVPYLVYQPGGNFAYLQIVLIGWVLARLAIAWWVVPLYYEREIYSPYDYIGSKLGPRTRSLTTYLFSLGGTLSQAARVYLTALVLEVVLNEPLTKLSAATSVPTLALAIAAVTLVAVAWTWMGGMATVVWTDLVLFFVFTASAVLLLVVIAGRLDLGFERIWRVGIDAHKLDFLDFDTSPAKAFTFWTAAIAASWGGIAAYGVDQLMAQRLLCCGSVRDARRAIIWSSVGVVVPVLVAFVGVGLFAYYERNAMSAEGLALYERKGDNVLLIFVTEVVPSGWKGLVVAGILAAAISSLDGILTALAQTLLTAVYLPARRRAVALMAALSRPSPEAEEKRSIRVARTLVLAFGLVLGVLAFAMDSWSRSYGSILELSLTMATFTQGALLAGLALAWLAPNIGGSGFLWSAPMSLAAVLAVAWHGGEENKAISQAVFTGCAVLFTLAWFSLRTVSDLKGGSSVRRVFLQLALVIAVSCGLVWVNRYGLFAVEKSARADTEWLYLPLAFPWYVPLGSTIAFVFGLVWARDDDVSCEVEDARRM
ncbi:MAG: hypothetical protein JNL28_14710 [Planctomycetes bacterium]|nr:hypothetical protein [Planctomycetota bacterium]